MAEFVENIWLSIFTAGPTPTLIIATNAAFAALQLVLAGLLFATYSVHFIILSILSGGLWWSINWFAKEVMMVQAEEDAKKAREAAIAGSAAADAQPGTLEDEYSGMDTGDTGDDTDEAEPTLKSDLDLSFNKTKGKGVRGVGGDALSGSRAMKSSSAALDVPSTGSAIKQRRAMNETSGDISTDSEWEKVSGSES